MSWYSVVTVFVICSAQHTGTLPHAGSSVQSFPSSAVHTHHLGSVRMQILFVQVTGRAQDFKRTYGYCATSPQATLENQPHAIPLPALSAFPIPYCLRTKVPDSE